MKRAGGLQPRLRLWLWLRVGPLTAFLACLNPQPDEHPTAQGGAVVAGNDSEGASLGPAAGEPPVFGIDDTPDGEALIPVQPQTPSASAPVPAPNADAGPAPGAPDAGPPPDAGSLD